MLITGTNTKFNQFACEILCGIVPIDMQTDFLTAKFMTEVRQQNDQLIVNALISHSPPIRYV